MIRPRRCRATGAALVTALVIAALTAAAAVAMASRTQLEIARTSWQIEAARRTALVARLEGDIRAGLRDDAKTGQLDAVADPWAEQKYSTRLRDIAASAFVRDEQRRFNLNNLAGFPRAPGTRARATTAAPDTSTSNATAPAAAAAMASSPRAAGERRSAAATNEQTPITQTSGDNGASERAGPEYVEKTRLVLDPSVARLIGGRGRPSELAALVAQSGVPRVSETYLERVEPAVSQPATGQNGDDVAGTTTTAADGSTSTPVPASRTFDAARNPAVVPAQASAANAASAPVQVSAANPGMVPSRSADDLWVMRFSLLLQRLDIEAPVTQAILDWVDADAEVRFPNGAEDAYYLKLETPYRAANRPFTDVSELLLVRGVTPAVYARLLPFVTVLPAEVAININTAPAEVLMSLAPEIDRRTADLIIAARAVQSFRSTDALVALPMLAMTSIDPTGIDVDSEYLAATTTLAHGDDVTHSRALIARARNGRTRIMSRRNGYFDD